MTNPLENKPAVKKPLWRHPLARFTLLAGLLFGTVYLLNVNTSSVVRTCQAQATVPGSPGAPSASEGSCASSEDSDGECTEDVSCEETGIASAVASMLRTRFYNDMVRVSVALENFLWDRVTEFLQSEFLQTQWIEQQMILFWRTMWHYNLLPGLQSMTRHLAYDLYQQSLNLHAQADATAQHDANLALQRHAIAEHGIRPGEQVCVAGSLTGGLTRASLFARAMRQAWENESAALGLNTRDEAAQDSAATSGSRRYRAYLDNFCDPAGNSGRNCGQVYDAEATPTPEQVEASRFYNADVEPVRRIYNALTIDVTDPRQSAMVTSLIDNMVGVPELDPILRGSVNTPAGIDVFFSRRAYLARHEAIRSIPQMITSWRMPGSLMGQFVGDLRAAANIHLSDISDNPSYREIMHALSVDRFNSGNYAANMMTNPSKIEMEKLSLSVFYLMQLRDYYELLERTALTLAVQVSIEAGDNPALRDTGSKAARPLTQN